MYATVLSLLFLTTTSSIVVMTSPMSDKEIEEVKELVNAELLKRETDVIRAHPKEKLVTSSNDKTDKIALTNNIATTDKPAITTTTKHTSKPTKRITKDPDYDLQHSIDNCINVYGTKKCKTLITMWKMDCNKDRMQEMCEKACGYCGNHVNPMVSCSNSRFGCCANGLTTKKDATGTNCPGCKDNIPDLCRGHEEDCNKVGMVGEWMQTNCKRTCDVCQFGGFIETKKPKCFDDPDQEVFCQAWKDESLCQQIPNMMEAYCPKTCSFC